MTRHLVDTGILIDHLNGRPEARETLARLTQESDGLYASAVTKVEVLAGMRASEEKATRTLFTLFRWVPLDDPIAERTGQMTREHHRRYPGIDFPDHIIAATAETLRATTVTLNTKHFPMVDRKERPYSHGLFANGSKALTPTLSLQGEGAYCESLAPAGGEG